MTYARVVSAQVTPEMLGELARIIEDLIIPDAELQPGFEGLLTLRDPATGKGMMITLWSSAESLIAGEASGYFNRQIAAAAPLLRGPAVRETYEVDVQRFPQLRSQT